MKQAQSGAGATRLLITMSWGIGDAIVVGLSAVDQIRRNDQAGNIEIDILCNQSQREIFAEDPRNSVKIIALFGGTHPGLHGYSKRTVVLGRRRKEQVRFAPGVAKDMYNPRGKDLFDHITSDQLTDAIMSQL